MPSKPIDHDAYKPGNLQAARIILADPEKYGGDEALAVKWARMVAGIYTAEPPNKSNLVPLKVKDL